MRSSRILAKWRAQQPALIAHLGHYIPPFIAYAAHAGYDGVWVDLEHQPWDAREVQAITAFGHLYDIDIMVRPSTREKAPLYRYLEDGAAGLMIPHVSTPDEARDLVRKVKFPPLGDRGMASFGLEANFQLDMEGGLQTLVDHAARETFLLVQLETVEAIANADAIAAVPGIDAIFIGPADLSIRLAVQPEGQRMTMDQAWDRVKAAADAHGKPWGCFATSIDPIKAQVARGARVLMYGSDFRLLREVLDRCGRELAEAVAAGHS